MEIKRIPRDRAAIEINHENIRLIEQNGTIMVRTGTAGFASYATFEVEDLKPLAEVFMAYLDEIKPIKAVLEGKNA